MQMGMNGMNVNMQQQPNMQQMAMNGMNGNMQQVFGFPMNGMNGMNTMSGAGMTGMQGMPPMVVGMMMPQQGYGPVMSGGHNRSSPGDMNGVTMNPLSPNTIFGGNVPIRMLGPAHQSS